MKKIFLLLILLAGFAFGQNTVQVDAVQVETTGAPVTIAYDCVDCEAYFDTCECEYKCGAEPDEQCDRACPEPAVKPVCTCENRQCVETKCGNGICDDGEANYCPPCTYSDPPCMAPCTMGTCPKDCTECAEEGEYTSGAVSPEYAYGCCDGLDVFNTKPDYVGGGMLCYDSDKGQPVCKYDGTRSEGWYYSKTGELLVYEDCTQTDFKIDVTTDKSRYGMNERAIVTATLYGDSVDGARVTGSVTAPDGSIETLDFSRGACSASTCECPIIECVTDPCPQPECRCDPYVKCSYQASYAAKQNGVHIATATASLDGQVLVDSTKFVVGDEEKRYVYLGDKFKIEQKEKVYVKDYREMEIDYIGDSSLCPVCRECPSGVDCSCPSCRTTSQFLITSSQWCTNSATDDCAATSTRLELSVGQTKSVMGVDITMVEKYDRIAVLLVEMQGTPPPEQYVRLGEEFKLQEDESVKVIDYDYMKITLEDFLTACPADSTNVMAECTVHAMLTVQMPCKSMDCEATRISLSAGQTREAFGVEIKAIRLSDGVGVFVVTKSDVENLVEVTVKPERQSIDYGDSATYEIVVQDNHERVICAANEMCDERVYIYNINVRNLPFYKEYEQQVRVTAGSSKSIRLVVTPYKVQAVSESQVAIRKVTGQVTKEVEVVPSRLYKFTVIATSNNNPRVTGSATAVLSIEPSNPPPMPDVIEIKLAKGWNLVSFPGEYKRLSGASNLIGFVYLKDEQKYVSLSEARRILGYDFKRYLATNSFWVYSRADAVLKVEIGTFISSSDLKLVPGWNMLPVTDDMVGGHLPDVIGDCELEKIYTWDADDQSWLKIDREYVFDMVGYGFAAKSLNYCSFSGPELTPPPMPE